MATFVVAHGAWSSGWAWKKMRPLMRARGHELWTPSLTGLGERTHLANPEIDLDTHIQDVVNVLEYEDLRDAILIGHSYGGMVATGVADRAGARLKALIYLDAFVPRDGQSLQDLVPPEHAEQQRKNAIDGWKVPANPVPPDTSPADKAWIESRRGLQPIKTVAQKLRLAHGETKLPRSYIYCSKKAPGDVFKQFADRFENDKAWRYFELDASHSPNVTAPEALAEILDKIAKSL
jgi:pimeloyl-ACP methyl ester carboxylesterase